MKCGDDNEGLVGLRPIRKGLGIKRTQLAAALGLHVNTVYQMESGKSSGTVANCRALARLLGCNAADLLSIPSATRLEEIIAAYKAREAEAAQARVDARREAGAA